MLYRFYILHIVKHIHEVIIVVPAIFQFQIDVMAAYVLLMLI
jgi:hypothetical protein